MVLAWSINEIKFLQDGFHKITFKAYALRFPLINYPFVFM